MSRRGEQSISKRKWRQNKMVKKMWNPKYDKTGKSLNSAQKKELLNLIEAQKIGDLKNKSSREYYAEKLDKLNVPYATQNKAVYLAEKHPNKYNQQIYEEVVNK
jgi:hypothetical protein